MESKRTNEPMPKGKKERVTGRKLVREIKERIEGGKEAKGRKEPTFYLSKWNVPPRLKEGSKTKGQ
jgi:hypothetical protein